MENQTSRLNEILRLGSELNSIQDLDILLEKILYDSRKVVNADAGTIYIREGEYLVFSHAQNDTHQAQLPPGRKLPYTAFKIKITPESLAGYVALSGEILNIPDVYRIPANAPYIFNSGYDEESNYKTKSILTVPMKTLKGEVIGVLQIINEKDKDGNIISFSPEDEPFILHFASSASMVLQRTRMTRALLLRMIKMAELRDPKETGPHVNRVSAYAVELYERWAIQKNISRKEIDQNRDILRMAAMLHDVGKVAISDLILKKPGRFTDEEYAVMKAHTYLGARILIDSQSDFDEAAREVALTHHENWDGTGYPGRVDISTGDLQEKDSAGNAVQLRGEEIPVFGRVVALADVYDALMSSRVYKKAWDEKDVLAEIKKLSGSKFDPEIVDIFFESYETLKSISHRYPDND